MKPDQANDDKPTPLWYRSIVLVFCIALGLCFVSNLGYMLVDLSLNGFHMGFASTTRAVDPNVATVCGALGAVLGGLLGWRLFFYPWRNHE